MPTLKTTLLSILFISSTLAYPTPLESPAADSVTLLAPAQLSVQCGCWNMCTLERLIDDSLVCETYCGKSKPDHPLTQIPD